MKRTILALTLMAALLAVGATIAAAADDTSKVQSVRVIDIWGAYVD